ncbi:hypothetical protein E8E11_008923 [Didymella keratinophila]|nr:hypothetical protein E8E11_008923 [Didymella keratinophila]
MLIPINGTNRQRHNQRSEDLSDGNKVIIDDHQVFPALRVTSAGPVVTKPVDAVDEPLPTALFKTFRHTVGEYPYIFLFFFVLDAGATILQVCHSNNAEELWPEHKNFVVKIKRSFDESVDDELNSWTATIFGTKGDEAQEELSEEAVKVKRSEIVYDQWRIVSDH